MIDLMIPFSDNKSAPYYEQIYCFIKKEILQGRIRSGERLPSTRLLASKLGVSRSTTQLAYDQLTAEGYLDARPGSGYYAANLSLLYTAIPANDAPEKQSEEDSAPGCPTAKEDLLDFSPRGIDVEHFPTNTWRKLYRDVLREENQELFAGGDHRGEIGLRRVICDYLQASRGISCRPEQIVVGAGNDYLLMLLTQVLGRRRIAMENPTYRQAGRVLAGQGHEILPLAMDRYGMRSDLLRDSEADIAYIMPSHQFPTGVVMPMSRRQEILAWAGQDEERYIIEDDYDSEFRYRGKPIPALCGADRHSKVVYLGTFSKAIAPAIRVAYMVIPESLCERFLESGAIYGVTVSRITQEVLRRFLSEGHFEKHLNRMRGIYRSKHDLLLDTILPLKERFHITGDLAGLHILLQSKEGICEAELIRQAREVGVRVYGMSSYLMKEESSDTILLGYANLSEEEIREGAEQLCRIWSK